MKIFFTPTKEYVSLSEGISLLADDLGIELSDNSAANVTLTVSEAPEAKLHVVLDGKNACITYGGGKARFFRALAILIKWLKDGKTAQTLTETPLFITNGAMVDMSRNAVMNVKTVKFFMRKMALMGLNTFMLYTEDTYEIDGRRYFGYMRGRYTADEIRELDAYAIKLGIELVPCIQTLGHLATALRWSAAGAYKDTPNALLAGADATYKLIDDMFRSISECFTSRRLHIGMDETHDLGTGKYLDRFGYRERQDIYFEHLSKVAKIAESYGFRPMMWSDMFFRMSGKNIPDYYDFDMRVVLPDDIGSYVPEGVQQVFWDYYRPNEDFYDVNIKKHRLLGKNTVFAGGIWTWSGHCPHFSRSLRHTIPALEACRKNEIKEIFATIWHNGSESCLIMALAGLAWYADYDYKGRYDEQSVKECFDFACSLSYDDFMKTELPEYPHGGDVGVSRSLLYNDPLIGLMDKHVEHMDAANYYKSVSEQLCGIENGKGMFTSAFDVIKKLSSLLENKADFGVRLKKAYDAGNKQALSDMLKECSVITEKLNALRESHRKAWFEYSKPFGWEVHDIRYGGLIMRFDTVKERLSAYLNGEINAIEELEADRLSFDGSADGSKIGESFLWYPYRNIATAGIL